MAWRGKAGQGRQSAAGLAAARGKQCKSCFSPSRLITVQTVLTKQHPPGTPLESSSRSLRGNWLCCICHLGSVRVPQVACVPQSDHCCIKAWGHIYLQLNFCNYFIIQVTSWLLFSFFLKKSVDRDLAPSSHTI